VRDALRAPAVHAISSCGACTFSDFLSGTMIRGPQIAVDLIRAFARPLRPPLAKRAEALFLIAAPLADTLSKPLI
jgi:hypothetical protein